MIDTTIKKVKGQLSPHGSMGQKYLLSGTRLSMRLWENLPAGKPTLSTSRGYETIGYVIKGRAELQMEGQTILLEEGDAWLVPKGAGHSYNIWSLLPRSRRRLLRPRCMRVTSMNR